MSLNFHVSPFILPGFFFFLIGFARYINAQNANEVLLALLVTASPIDISRIHSSALRANCNTCMYTRVHLRIVACITLIKCMQTRVCTHTHTHIHKVSRMQRARPAGARARTHSDTHTHTKIKLRWWWAMVYKANGITFSEATHYNNKIKQRSNARIR